ncbi:MAG: exonuclease SbcCD subunit D [Actinomycetota bacterium]|nr:exonuclease SbcCD subunit D [Actinomycetota bacterium]
MRILHTSDWHVGRTFHGHDLLSDQRAVLTAISAVVAEHAVDVVVIPGDLYDRAIPSTEAVAVLTGALQDIRAAGAQIVASAGNHDSAPRLGAFSGFLAAGGLHLRTSISRIADPVLLPDEHGEIAFYPLPYLEPEVVRRAFGIDGAASHQAVMTVAMDAVRADLAQRPGVRSVVLAHAFVVGAVAGGSERSIAVGGVESVTGEVFDGIDYVALGHLHGKQTLSERMRYSGSPLAYSFTEAGHRKSLWLIDIDAAGAIDARSLELPIPRPLAEVVGTLPEILGGNDDLVEHYLSARLTDPVRPLEAMRRLKEKFPYAVTLSWEPPDGTSDPDSWTAGTVSAVGSSDPQLIERFLLDCRGAGPSESEGLLIGQGLALARTAAAG